MDDQTGSEWDPATGRAIGGPREGEHLEQVPGVVSYRDAWTTFHPQSALWSASGQAQGRRIKIAN